MSCIVLVLTLPSKRAIAPPTQSDHAEISLGSNPMSLTMKGCNWSVAGGFVASKSKTAVGEVENWACKRTRCTWGMCGTWVVSRWMAGI
eukprot:294229-Ditylum_brightwellii.AAC.1